MDLKDYLKKSIPEFQQGNPSLDSYLDAAGDFLNGIKEAIEHFDYSHDYEKGEEFNIEYSLLGQGLNVPRALPLDVKRTIVRDLQEILIKNGTEDSLIQSLRLIGFNAEIRRGWLPSPRNIRKGFIKDPVTGEMKRYDVNKYVYAEMLYGTEKVTENGVFFDGYRYQDTFQENVIENLPILGETYKTFPPNDVAVSKTPYIIVRFEEGDFNVTVEDYVDPETGETYTFSSDEEFRLVNEVIDYFISGQQRPSTVRVIIVVSLQPFEDFLEFDEEYSDTHTYNPDGGDEYGDEYETMDDMFVDVRTYAETKVGFAGNPIGINGFYSSPLSSYVPVNIDEESGDRTEVNATDSSSSNETIDLVDDIYIGMRLNSSLTITSESTEPLVVSKSYSINMFDDFEETVQTLSFGDSVTIDSTINDLVHCVRVGVPLVGIETDGELITDENDNVIQTISGDKFRINLSMSHNPFNVEW